MKISKKLRKELIEWGAFLGIIGFLYISGLHTEVAGFVQRIVLSTGIIQPDVDENTFEELSTYNFKILSLETNEVVAFSEFKGEVLFVNLWATWCPPCIAEMPSIQKFYTEYKNKDMKFLLISSEDDSEKIRKFLRRKNYDFPVYQLLSPLPSELVSRSIPTTFVIDKMGNIILRNTGMANYNTEKFKSFIDDQL